MRRTSTTVDVGTQPTFDVDLRQQFKALEEKNSRRFNGLLAAVIVLGLVIIAGLVVGFIVIGLQGRDVSDVKDEVGDIWKTVSDILDCTQQIKADIADLGNTTGNITMEVEQIVEDALADFFPRPLPISRYLCAPANTLELPEEVNVLLSANLTNQNLPSFPSMSVSYNSNNGAITVNSDLPDGQAVSIRVVIQVLISNAGSDSGDEEGTFSLIMSSSANCEFENCPNGFFSQLGHFDPNAKLFSDSGLIITIDRAFTVESGFRFFVFLRSNSGNGEVRGQENGDATPCATFSISIQAATPAFAV